MSADEWMSAVGRQIHEGLERVLPTVGAQDLFSTPHEHNGSLVIAAAAIERAGGFGFGAGGDDDGDGGGGGGAGGATQARPVAVIHVRDDGVTVAPVIDFTKAAIAGLAVLAVFVRTWTKR